MILDFYLNSTPHPSTHQTLKEMQAWNDNKLNGVHNYITWFFPTRRHSCSVDSIAITDEEIQEFKTNPILRKQILRNYYRMLKFYGFVFTGDKVIKSNNYEDNKHYWLCEQTPNFGRIARMLQSLMLLGFSQAAMLFYDALMQAYSKEEQIIPVKVLDYWHSSVYDKSNWDSNIFWWQLQTGGNVK